MKMNDMVNGGQQHGGQQQSKTEGKLEVKRRKQAKLTPTEILAPLRLSSSPISSSAVFTDRLVTKTTFHLPQPTTARKAELIEKYWEIRQKYK